MFRICEDRKIHRGLWSATLVALMVALAGCAGQPTQQPSTPEQADARNRASIHTELGASYLSRGQVGIALDELNKAVSYDPTYARAYDILGLVNMELHEDDAAVRNFEQALKLSPDDSDTHNNYGWFLCQRNHIDESIKHFLAAVKNPLYQSPEQSYVNAGVCLLKKNDVAGAEDFFNKALKIQPQNPQALYHLADFNYLRGQYLVAKSYLARLSHVSEDTPESLWLALRIERKLGNKSAEGSYALQLKRKFPDSPQTQALLSERYE